MRLFIDYKEERVRYFLDIPILSELFTNVNVLVIRMIAETRCYVSLDMAVMLTVCLSDV